MFAVCKTLNFRYLYQNSNHFNPSSLPHHENKFLNYASFRMKICVNSFVLFAKLSFFYEKYRKYFANYKIICTFASFFGVLYVCQSTIASSRRDVCGAYSITLAFVGGVCRHIEKGVYMMLCFGILESRKFNFYSKTLQR